MDLATVVGLVIAIVSIVVSVFLEGGSLLSLIKPSAGVLILGGTIGVTVMGFRGRDLRKVPLAILAAFRVQHEDPRQAINQMVAMAERARREGILSLQDVVKQIRVPLLARGLQLIVDGTDPDVVRTTLQEQVAVDEHRRMVAASALEAAGGYAPTIGIIGTVMGLVQVLQHLSEADKLGHSIALAFLATFYGIASANILWLPLASKVKQNIQHEALMARMYITGVVGLQTGEAPRALREKLELYVIEGYRGVEDER